MTNTQAAERQAAHECLMTELVDALEGLLATLERHLGVREAAPGTPVANARAALARAKEQQQ